MIHRLTSGLDPVQVPSTGQDDITFASSQASVTTPTVSSTAKRNSMDLSRSGGGSATRLIRITKSSAAVQ